MLYFDEKLVANSRHHKNWWNEVSAQRNHFVNSEKQLLNSSGIVTNDAAILPRDSWLELDNITRQVMRHDEGMTYMGDLMPLAKAVDIGKLVHINRVSSDAGKVTRSMSGQTPDGMDKVTYDYRGTIVPMFSDAYGREWREWKSHQSENFDALIDDQEAITAGIKRDMAKYALDGDDKLSVGGYDSYGIRTSPLSKVLNLGTGAGGASIDLASKDTTSDAVEGFINNPFGQMLDDNFISEGVNLYVSPEIARNWDRPYSGSTGFKIGSLMEAIKANRRINDVKVTFELSGNEFFGFVPNSRYIRPLVGMAVNTTALARLNPTDNYNFMVMGAMGLEIRADANERTGVFYSTVVNA